jgi:hypothetical protein
MIMKGDGMSVALFGGMARYAVADNLQRWLAALPRWDPGATEAWGPFVTRYNEAEALLLQLIGKLPGARLIVSSGGRSVHLALSGLAVESSVGLTSTCRIWIARAKTGPIQ